MIAAVLAGLAGIAVGFFFGCLVSPGSVVVVEEPPGPPIPDQVWVVNGIGRVVIESSHSHNTVRYRPEGSDMSKTCAESDFMTHAKLATTLAEFAGLEIPSPLDG